MKSSNRLPQQTIYFNGLNGDTGHYLIPPRDVAELEQVSSEPSSSLAERKLDSGQVAGNLADVGWGIVWPPVLTKECSIDEGAVDTDTVDTGTVDTGTVDADFSEERRAALQPLIEHRRQQTQRDHLEFQLLSHETCAEFRERHGVGPGSSNTARLPYYLLIVASPHEISFDFQSALAASHAVGRLDFSQIEDFESYIAALLKYETEGPPSHQKAAFFGVSHQNDELTQSSVEHFVKGLDSEIAQDNPSWDIQTILRQAADKAQFLRLLRQEQNLSVLFSASHGVGFLPNSKRQAAQQGALLCADYPGPERWDRDLGLPDEFLLSANDIDENLDLSGLVTCHFACYSYGTSREDLYSLESPNLKAHQSFISPLPQKLLARGALAVIGHVGLTLEESYLWYSAGPQFSAFKNVLQEIMVGEPIGHAMDYIRSRQRELAIEISQEAKLAIRRGDDLGSLGKLRAWAAHEDARHFMVLGDPAARLKV